MLKKHSKRDERLHCHDEARPSLPLGCFSCRERGLCGGIRIGLDIIDCTSYCCHNPTSCDLVCRNNAETYVQRVREVDGLPLTNVPRAPVLDIASLPPFVPLIMHGSRLKGSNTSHTVAFPLSYFFSHRSGLPRFSSIKEFRSFFKVGESDKIILSGTDEDQLIEPWWRLGEDLRRAVIKNLIALNVSVVTTPNFSVFNNRPRWDDMHSMKRIGLVHSEFLQAGLPAALHVNGRTDRDLERWTEYVVAREEVSILAYEFTTGTRWKDRQIQHAQWLVDLAQTVRRPLDLIIRGGTSALSTLRQHYRTVTFLDTSAFMKTMNRKRAALGNDGRLKWQQNPTVKGQPLDDLLWSNVEILERIHLTKYASQKRLALSAAE